MSDSEVAVERTGGVLTVSLDRQRAGNALSSSMIGTLARTFEAVREDRSIRAVLVQGAGAHFCSGGDVREFEQLLGLPPALRRAAFAENMAAANAMIRAFAAIPVAVVTACQGTVAGGGLTFLLAADVVLADETATLLFSHQRLGLPPDGGVSALLPGAIGRRRATELVLTAATVDADEALRLGLVSRLVDVDRLQHEAAIVAERLAQGPVDAARAAKRLLRQNGDTLLATQLDAERDAIIDAVGSPDFEEGLRAFLERRRASFPSAQAGGER